ncbi:MAG: glycosyltransferase [Planctomycetota bacterium]|nr:glycosyltransferase [Planctomycetota bacterium]
MTHPTQPTDLLLLLPDLRAGGLEKVASDVLRATCGEFRTHVVRFAPVEPPPVPPDGVGIETILRRPGFDLGFIRGLAAAIRRVRPRLLHLHNPTALFYGALAARMSQGPRILYTDHGQEASVTRRAARALRLLRPSGAIAVAVANHLAPGLTRELGFPADDVAVIHNGVEASTDRPPRESRPLRIGTVARLSASKDVATVIRAFGILRRSVPAVTLEVVGDGVERMPLEGLVERLSLGDHVRFAGRRDDVRRLARSFDVFVAASRTEGLPLAVLEAMAEGCAVVCSDIPGHREILGEGRAGRLFPAGDAGSLSATLAALALDPSLRDRMSRDAQQLQRDRYSVTAMVEGYRALYARMLR